MKGDLIFITFLIVPLILLITLIKWELKDYVNRKIKNMKYLLFLIPTLGLAQIPDTIYYTLYQAPTLGSSESFYVVYEGKTLPNTLLTIPQPIDKAMTGNEVAEYVFNLIYRYENMNWLDEARVQQRIKSGNLMPNANKIIQDFTGSGYFPNARNKFINRLQGVYIVRALNKTNEYFLIRNNGTIVQCDENGTVITGGKTGSLQILTENRFRIASYFGAEIGTATFNKELDSSFFFSNQAQVRIRKIK